ncbi:MAG: DUF4465 domain-containing protein [Prevotellaceae bacterium]|jgi:hypothetical protein|nr:DUF4465 domain-containing protein [Prevotellaceae bacterium]
MKEINFLKKWILTTVAFVLVSANINAQVITLDLSRPTSPESFDFDANGVWTETYNYKDYPFIEFGTMAFSHKNTVFEVFNRLAEDYEDEEFAAEMIEMFGLYDAIWDGVTVSKNGDNAEHRTSWVSNQWGNMAGGGIKTDARGNVLKDEDGTVLTDPDAPYLLAYLSDMSWLESAFGFVPASPSLQAVFSDTYQAVGVYVNSSPWPYYSHINGDGFARALDQDGDYFKLIIHGLDANYEENGKTVEYYLARNEGGTLIQSPNWEWVDLSALGEIGGLYFTMESTDNDAYGMRTATYFCMDKLQVRSTQEIQIPAHTYEITAPKDAAVFVGEKDQSVTVLGNYLKKHYIPFTEKPAVAVIEEGDTKTWYYNVERIHNYRISREGSITQVGTFTPSTFEGRVDTMRVFTEAQLTAYSPQEIDHDVNSLEGRNIADVLLNINAQGHLKLPLADTTFQLVNCRNWQAIDTDVNNYFIDPDFHYMVVNENGEIDKSVITVSEKGLITPVGEGTAIVLVTYDAMVAYHIQQGSIPPGTPANTPVLFSALWGENTGVFVVTVDNSQATGINTNMLINQYWSEMNGNEKVESTAIDAEHDILYYEAGKGSFAYTFKPEGVSEVFVATPAVTATGTSYSGFSTDSVTVNADGSYTVNVTFGRNIVKLVSAGGKAVYQVLTAKPVTWEVSNLTDPGTEKFNAGDEISVKFNTLYHPANKLSGIYNMSAGIQYTGENVNFPLILGPGQYTFASRAQEYRMTVPEDFEGDEYILTNGVIKVQGFGSYYGEHRNITLQNGVDPNLNASVRTAYFGALPEISIPLNAAVSSIRPIDANTTVSVYPNPFAGYIIVNTTTAGTATVYNLSGAAVLSAGLINGSNRIETSALPKGVYVLKVGENTIKIVK